VSGALLYFSSTGGYFPPVVFLTSNQSVETYY
jgi:hypothetical protein